MAFRRGVAAVVVEVDRRVESVTVPDARDFLDRVDSIVELVSGPSRQVE